MRRVTNFISFCLVFLFIAAYPQTSEIDSLKNYISARSDDSLKVNALIALSGKYLGSDLQEAIRWGYKALDLAEEIDFQKGRAYAYKAIGLGNYYQANYPEAVVQFQNSLAVFDSISFKVGVTRGRKLIWSASGNALCISIPPTFNTTALILFSTAGIMPPMKPPQLHPR